MNEHTLLFVMDLDFGKICIDGWVGWGDLVIRSRSEFPDTFLGRSFLPRLSVRGCIFLLCIITRHTIMRTDSRYIGLVMG